MSTLGFIEQLMDNNNHFYSVALQQFDWWKKVQGTKVLVTRIKEHTQYKTVFGTIANSTLADDQDSNKFDYVILISMNDMLKIFQKSINQLTFYDNKDILKLGDLLTFSRKDQEYKWKVIDVQTFGESGGVVYQYQIAGLTEVETTIKSNK